MEVVLFMLKYVAGPIVAVIVTLLFKEPIEDYLAPIAMRLGSKKDQTIAGVWKCTFYYEDDGEGRDEVIEIKSFLGRYLGRIIPKHNQRSSDGCHIDRLPVTV